MLEHMAYLVLTEHRPVTYKDILTFTVDGKQYEMKHGTFRNKISALVKEGQVELDYNSNLTYYTLRGHRFGNRITLYHAEVNSGNKHRKTQLTKLIEELPLGERSLHNIRLKFRVEGLWELFYKAVDSDIADSAHTTDTISHSFKNPILRMNKKSKDIVISTNKINNLLIGMTVHKTDTISVTVACSLNPVAMNTKELFNLASALTRAEEKLRLLIEDVSISRQDVSNTSKGQANFQTIIVPSYETWVVTMWHLGRDSQTEYSGDKFSFNTMDALDVLARVYTKEMDDGKIRIRLEKQEYPNKTFAEAIYERL
jgi:ribosomal protein L19E